MLGSNSEEQCKKILEKYHFETVRRLGKGSYGLVFLTSKFVNAANFSAVKCINLKKATKDPKLKMYIQQETETMSSLNHPNIVRLDNAFSDSGWHFFVMEFCDMSTLLNYQSKMTSKVFSLTESIRIFKQIISGLQAIHANNIIHRDIKCDNIFLSKKKGGSFVCKIGDFGFAKVIHDTTKTNCGTTLYMAPQVLFNRPYDQKVDNWSVSVVFYYLLFGEYPFKTLNIQKQIQDKCSKGYKLTDHHAQAALETRFKKEEIIQLQNFFQNAFVINPKERISLKQIQEHPLLNMPEKELSFQSTSDDQAESEVQWEKSHILYIQNVLRDIYSQKFFDPYLKEASKFYLNKVIKMFLRDSSVTKFMKEQPSTKLAIQLNQIAKQVDGDLCESMNELEKHHVQLKKIPKFYEGFHLSHQQFNAFKQGYRNTIGRVFEEIHAKLPDSQKKSILKFKIFTCHLINRVFKNGIKKEVFPFYQAWLKKNNKKSTVKEINFDHFEEWIHSETSEKLLQSIEVLNKTFYKKQ